MLSSALWTSWVLPSAMALSILRRMMFIRVSVSTTLAAIIFLFWAWRVIVVEMPTEMSKTITIIEIIFVLSIMT